MTTVHVSRDARGRITGVYLNEQPGYATEALDDQAAEVRAFLADASIYRRAGGARLARQFRRRLARDPLAALVERAKADTTP